MMTNSGSPCQDLSTKGRIQVGSVVRAKAGHVLRCGSGVYPQAVVISLDPFIMVSEETDMRWSCFPIENVYLTGHAPKNLLDKCMRRLES